MTPQSLRALTPGANTKGAPFRVRTEMRDIVMAASLKGGVVLQTAHRDASTEIRRLPKTTTFEDALATATLAGSLSLGIVPCGECYALRYTRMNKREVFARIKPDMTETCGREVMLADSSDGKLYIVQGAANAMRAEVLLAHLSSMMGWKARWERVVSKTQHTTSHLVFATAPPKSWAARLTDPMSRETFPITIDVFRKEPEHKKAFKPYSTAGQETDGDGFYTVGASSRPNPKTAMQRMRMREGGQWSDQERDDDDLDSLKPHSESEGEDEIDEEHEQAVQKVKLLRAEQLHQKVQLRLNPTR